MLTTHSVVLLLLVFLPFSLAAQANVTVGKSGLVFDPSDVTAAAGDILQFTFYPQNHSIAQSTFDKPCEPLDDGIFSGFFPVQEGTAKQVFTVTLNDTNPIWIYCSQGKHCQNGMAMVVNPPEGNTLTDYKDSAKNVARSGSQTEVKGGVVSYASASGSSSVSESSSASADIGSTTVTAASNSPTAPSTDANASTNHNAGGKVVLYLSMVLFPN